MKNAVIYARVSDQKQADADVSVPAQLDACRKTAEQLGARVLDEFVDDGRSAYKAGNRPAFSRAIQRATSGPATYFICWSSSRFGRNRFEAALAKSDLDRAGVGIVYVSTPVDRSTDVGWMVDGFMELMDEWQSRRNASDTRRSMIRIAESGYFAGGSVPFGYRSVPADDNPKRRRLVIDEAEALLVREAFTRRLRGEGAYAIADALNRQGTLYRGKRWTKATVLYLLRSQSSLGNRVWGRRQGREHRVADAADITVMPTHPAIIERDTWEKVQDLLDQAAPTPAASSPRSDHVFTGMLVCGACGSRLTTVTGRGRSKVYTYYRCRASLVHRTCVQKAIPAESLDEWLTDQIVLRVISVTALTDLAKRIEDASGTWRSDWETRHKALTAAAADIKRRQSRLYEILELHGQGAPNLGDLSSRLHEHSASLRAIEQQLDALREQRKAMEQAEGVQIDPHAVVNRVRTAVRESDNAKRTRQLFAEFVARVEIADGEAKIHYEPARLLAASPVRSDRIWLPRTDSNRRPSD